MGEDSNGVEAPPAASRPPQQPATGAVPPSVSPDVNDAGTKDSNNNANETGAAAGDQEEPNQEAEAVGKPHGAGGAGTRAEKKPTAGTDAPCPATPPGTRTPERDVAPAPQTGEHRAQAAETEPDINTAKRDGCTTPSPPPATAAHDSEGSDAHNADGRGSPLHGEKPRQSAGASVKRDVAAAKSRLLAFPSFSRDKKAVKSGGVDTASPERGKAGEEGEEHKGKGNERRKRFWK